MAYKVTRTDPIIFGDALPANPNISQIGSQAAGSLLYTKVLAQIMAGVNYPNGWQASVVGNQSPTIEDFTGMCFVLTSLLKMIVQQGIPEWSATETYYTNAYVTVAGVTYISKTDANLNNNPVTDTNNWKTLSSQILSSGGPLLLAKVCFDGRTPSIIYGTPFNVASVTKVAAGIYDVNFVNPLPAGYGLAGSAGTPNGDTGLPGDNNPISGGAPGYVGVQTTTKKRIFCYESGGNIGPEDSSYISVAFF